MSFDVFRNLIRTFYKRSTMQLRGLFLKGGAQGFPGRTDYPVFDIVHTFVRGFIDQVTGDIKY